jgi:parvulin-like peptidyl-prolyl isomerase
VPPPPPADAVAATVNGQPIPEMAVYRGLKRVPPDKHGEARPEIVNFLIDNTLIDQYLQQMQVAVDKKEVEKRIEEMKGEIKKRNMEFPKVLQDMVLTEAELREHITADLRWEKYADTQATDKVLKELFDGNKNMFDGSMVRAKHILLTPAATDAKAVEAAIAQLQGIKKQVEGKAAEAVAKLPQGADNLTKEKTRTATLDEAFASQARELSACPSKAQGGDVGWFHRAGIMVEPFAKAAFDLKPYQMTDVVKTQFGYHLILVTDRKDGRDAKFEDAKNDVKEVYCDRLREQVSAQMRQRSKIEVTPPKK